MTFWKDKAGNELTFKEFMTRWKQGLEGVTPLQQIRIQYKSSYIMIIGLLCGIVVSIMAIKTLWWVLIILIAALINATVTTLGIWQKKLAYERIEEMMSGNVGEELINEKKQGKENDGK